MKTKIYKLMASTVLIVMTGCSPRPPATNLERCNAYEKASVACHLPIYAILADPGGYIGREVQLTGFLVAGSAIPTLYPGRESWGAADLASGIALTGDELTIQQLIDERFSYVTIRGSVSHIAFSKAQPNIVLAVSSVVVIYRPDDFTERETRLQKQESEY